MIDQTLLNLLACPKCKGTVQAYGPEALSCATCKLAYPIRSGIPVMLIEEATRLG